MKLFLSRMHFPVTTLGPGRRIGIWLQGCSIRCPGCISLDTWAKGRGATTVDAVLDSVRPWLAAADGITVSGGEPFDQEAALEALLHGLRARTSADILVFSGYPLERLESALKRLTGLIDGLICDPYKADVAQTRAMRGSDNQRLILFSDLGRLRLGHLDRPRQVDDDALDLMLDEDGNAWFAGIPARGDLRRLVHLLEAQGHRAAATEAKTFPATDLA